MNGVRMIGFAQWTMWERTLWLSMFELNPVELNTNPGRNSFILNPTANDFNGPPTGTGNTVFLSQVTMKKKNGLWSHQDLLVS